MNAGEAARWADALSRGASAGGATCGDLPVREIVDPTLLDRDEEAVFGRAWLPVARLSELAREGSWKRVDVGRRRWLVVRDGAAVRVHANVCPHRGSLLVEEPEGCVGAFRCPYHGLVWRHDGSLASDAARFGLGDGEGEPWRPHLGAVRSETWGGWVWANADPEAPPLLDFLGPDLLDLLAGWPLEQAEVKHTQRYEVDIGWRLGVEGFLEPLHVQSVHPRTVHPVLDYRRGAITCWGDHSVMASPWRLADLYGDGPLGRQSRAAGVPNFEGPPEVMGRANWTLLVFPMLTVSLLPNHLTVLTVWPVSPTRCVFLQQVLGAPSETDEQRAWYTSLGAGYDQLAREDVVNLTRVHEGLRANPGAVHRLSAFETRLAHFHERLRTWHRRVEG